MADKENYALHLTPFAASQRAVAFTSDAHPHPAKKMRVELVDLPFLSNADPLLIPNPPTPPLHRPNLQRRSREEQNSVLAPAVTSDSSEPGSGNNAPYDSDIHRYLRSKEVVAKNRPVANYMATVQKDINANMRAVLVDWLVEVAEEYKLLSDTVYLSVSYIDRFLSFNAVTRQNLQLLGVTSMFIASKYEEVDQPTVNEFCDITDNTYTKEQVLKMERDMLNCFKFELGNPTISTFLWIFSQAGQEDEKYPPLKLQFLSCYIAELSLLDYGCLRFLPSLVASSVVFVSRYTIDAKRHPWSKKLIECTGYNGVDLKDCIHALLDLQLKNKAPDLTAIRDKYNQHRFKCVSSLVPSADVPAIYFEEPNE
ncbi:cyclin-A3-1-like [Curcuma longa]|uniref:cyclin-A3-1-like n=1 Tax=Curcuma longa TaxID=136217 RepID=UPI003D9F1C90